MNEYYIFELPKGTCEISLTQWSDNRSGLIRVEYNDLYTVESLPDANTTALVKTLLDIVSKVLSN